MNTISKYLLIFLLFIPLNVFSIPPFLSHQGRLIHTDNVPVTGVTEITFSIYNSANGVEPLWTETQALAFEDGYYSVVMGTVEPILGIAFENDRLYLGITMEDNDELLPRTRLTAVPFAFRSNLAEAVDGPVNAIGGITVEGIQIIDETGQWVGPDVGMNEDELNSYLSSEGYVTNNDLDDREYITNNDLEAGEYITNDDLDTRGYVTNDDLEAGEYMTNNDLDTRGYVTNDDLDTREYVTNSDLEAGGYVTSSDLATVATTGEFGDLNSIPDGLEDGDNDTTYTGSDGILLNGTNFTLDPEVASTFVTTELTWSAITDKPEGFADDTDNILSESEVIAIIEGTPLTLAEGSNVTGQTVLQRFNASETSVNPGEYIEVIHNLDTHRVAVSGWQKEGENPWTIATITVGSSGSQCSGCGDGSEGAVNFTNNQIAGTHNYTTFTISQGATVTVTGSNPLIINATESVTINGTLNLSGGPGISTPTGGIDTFPGGAGGGGGGQAGGTSSYASVPGGSGVGPSGGGGGIGGVGAGGGGGGGGYGTSGATGGTSTYSTPLAGGSGGNSYGDATLNTLQGGSGGGGGGYGSGHNCAGGTGGGGGGAVKIVAPEIIINGNIYANGGVGGTSDNAGRNWNDDGGAGGGGSGGAIWLRGNTVEISGNVQAQGGAGGITQNGDTPYKGGAGGTGGNGRIKIDAVNLSGSTTPSPHEGNVTDLGFSAPTIEATITQPDSNTVRFYNRSDEAVDMELVVIY